MSLNHQLFQSFPSIDLDLVGGFRGLGTAYARCHYFLDFPLALILAHHLRLKRAFERSGVSPSKSALVWLGNEGQ